MDVYLCSVLALSFQPPLILRCICNSRKDIAVLKSVEKEKMELVVGASDATMKSLLGKLGGLLAQEYTLIRGV